MKSKKERVLERLESFGFYKPQCQFILKKFDFERVVDVVNYYGWVLKYKKDREYTHRYFYYLLNNFDFEKTWPEYRDYYKLKKACSSLDLPKPKSYTLAGKKLGEDHKVDDSPTNIIEFIKYGTKNKESN